MRNEEPTSAQPLLGVGREHVEQLGHAAAGERIGPAAAPVLLGLPRHQLMELGAVLRRARLEQHVVEVAAQLPFLVERRLDVLALLDALQVLVPARGVSMTGAGTVANDDRRSDWAPTRSLSSSTSRFAASRSCGHDQGRPGSWTNPWRVLSLRPMAVATPRTRSSNGRKPTTVRPSSNTATRARSETSSTARAKPPVRNGFASSSDAAWNSRQRASSSSPSSRGRTTVALTDVPSSVTPPPSPWWGFLRRRVRRPEPRSARTVPIAHLQDSRCDRRPTLTPAGVARCSSLRIRPVIGSADLAAAPCDKMRTPTSRREQPMDDVRRVMAGTVGVADPAVPQ